MTTAYDPSPWHKRVEADLAGADFEKRLVTTTLDGLRVDPLFHAGMADCEPLDTEPGSGTFARSASLTGAPNGWEVGAEIYRVASERVIGRALEEAEGGADTIVLRMHDRVAGRPDGTFFGGWAPATRRDLAAGLARLEERGLGLEIDGGLRTPSFLDGLAALRPTANFARGLRFHFDPWAEAARWGHGNLAGPLMAAAPRLAEYAWTDDANVSPFIHSTRVWHEAGATLVDETALALASMVRTLRTLDASSIPPEEAAGLFGLEVTVGRDMLAEVARLRAARVVWATILEACGVDEGERGLLLLARTSRRILTRRDPWTNLLRGTVASVAAALGGAARLVVEPLDAALGCPGTLGRRMARNTQLILRHEAQLHRVLDPMGGAWAMEAMTRRLATAILASFREIESEGGIDVALGSGWVQRRIAATRDERACILATRRMPILGVSEFPLLDERMPEIEPVDEAAALAGLGGSSEPWAKPPGRVPAEIRLAPGRDAEAWEHLRDRADAARAKGISTHVFLASFGRLAEHNARSTWTTNLLASGGLETLPAPPCEAPEQIPALVAAWEQAGRPALVLSASDATLAMFGAAVLNAFRDAGAALVGLAGKPGTADLAVDFSLWAGGDAHALLVSLHARMGVFA